MTTPQQAIDAGFTNLSFSDGFTTLDVGDNGTHNWYPRTVLLNDAQATPPSGYSLVDPLESSVRLITNKVSPGVWTPGSLYTFDGIGLTGGQSWSHGYFEVRAKWNPTFGSWPVFRLYGVEFTRGEAANAAEIDIFNGQGGDPYAFYAISHLGDTSPSTDVDVVNNQRIIVPDIDFTTYHDYGLLWQPGQLTWYLDDQFMATAPSFHTQEQQEMYIVLSIQEGVSFVQNADTYVPSTSFTTDVDSVNVWTAP